MSDCFHNWPIDCIIIDCGIIDCVIIVICQLFVWISGTLEQRILFTHQFTLSELPYFAIVVN